MRDQANYHHDLFISYAEADSAWVQGYLIPALGLPEQHVITRQAFRPGAPLVAEIERAVTSSWYTILVLSPAYLADEWSSLSEHLASHFTIVQQQKLLIPLILKTCELPLRIDFRVRLDCTDQANWNSEIARLRRLLDQPEPVLEKINCPYPGMVSFRADDARFFYGREAEIDDMLQYLRHQRFLVVIGDSGSGKSSLISAGLLPKLNESSFFPPGYWLVRTMRPGIQPLQSLLQVIGADLTQSTQAISDLLTANPPAQRLLLVIDQFEELFTQVSQQDKADFIAVLKALRETGSCAVVIALRGDFFYTDLKSSDLWPVVPSERLEIDPLRGQALRDAILKPAAREGVYLEPGLVELLLKDAADERGVLPLVQETMVQLWDKMEGRLILLGVYEQLGSGKRSGLAGALVTKADASLAALAHRSPHHETVARRIFVRLVQFGEGRPDTRRQQPEFALRSWDDDPQVFDQTLQFLSENRLLTLSGEEEDKDRMVDIAHEALYTEWPTLEECVREWRKPEQMRRRLEDWVIAWISRNRDPKALLNELELSQAEEWLKGQEAGELGYSQVLRELVGASRTALDEEAARQRRFKRFQLWAVAAITILIVVVVSAIAVGQFRVAEEQKKALEAALLRRLVLESGDLLDDHYDQSLLLSIEAFRLEDTVETRDNLLRVLRARPELIRYIPAPLGDTPTAIVFSPDGNTLVARTRSSIRLWDASRGEAIEPILVEINGITASSPDGKTGYSAEPDNIRFWNLMSGEAHDLLTNSQTSGGSGLLSPDNRIRASSQYLSRGDIVVRLEDPMTGQALGWLEGFFDEEPVMAFSPDSQLLATAFYVGPFRTESWPSMDVIVWTFEAYDRDDKEYDFCIDNDRHYDGEECIIGRGNAGQGYWGDEKNRYLVPGVTDMTFSPDGQYLAVTVQESTDVVYLMDLGSDRTHILWKRETTVGSLSLTTLTSNCAGLVAVGREDGKIIFQAIDEGVNTSREPLTHPGSVEALAFSPDCRRLASMGSGVIVLWDLMAVDVPPPFELRIDTRPGDIAPITSWDYSGAVSGSECIRSRHQLDPRSPCVQSAIIGDFSGFTGIVTSLMVSPDGKILAAGIFNEFDYEEQPYQGCCYRGEVWLWPSGPNSAVYLGYHEYVVTKLIFSPDSKILASVDQDGAIMIWDVDLKSLIARACYKANRPLTEDEWLFFMGQDRPFKATCPSFEWPDRSRLDVSLKQLEQLLPTPKPTP